MRLPIPDNQHLHGFDINAFLTSLPAVSPKPVPIVGIGGAVRQPTTALSNPPTAAVKPSNWLETLSNTAQQVLPGIAATVLSIRQQKALNKLNVQRAAAGQPPIDIADYNEASAPVIKIKGGVDSGTSKNLLIGGGLVAAALLFIAMKKSK